MQAQSNSRAAILERFHKIASGRPIVGGGAGTGLSAKCAEAGGNRPDHHLQFRSIPHGRTRQPGGLDALRRRQRDRHGHGTEVLPVVTRTPVLAGVCATDPFRVMSRFLQDVRDEGFAGVQNFPTVGLIDGDFRRGLEETGMGFDKEVRMIAQAREMNLLTCPYVHNDDESRAMAEAGADILVPHMGLTTKGMIGAARRSRSKRPHDGSKAWRTPRGRFARTSWCFATADRSPSRATSPRSSRGPPGSPDSSARAASSGFPPKRRSSRKLTRSLNSAYIELDSSSKSNSSEQSSASSANSSHHSISWPSSSATLDPPDSTASCSSNSIVTTARPCGNPSGTRKTMR